MKKPPPPPVIRRLTLVIETAPRARKPRVRAWRLEWLAASPPPGRPAEQPKAMPQSAAALTRPEDPTP